MLPFRSDNNCFISPKVLVPNQSVLEHLLYKTPGEKKKQKSVNVTYPADIPSCRIVFMETLKAIPEWEDIKKSKRRNTCQE